MQPTPSTSTQWGRVADVHGDHDPERPVARASLLDAVTDLRADVEATVFPLPLADVEHARERRRALLEQLDDHLLPRLRELSAPGLVVVAGSTGAGKSTLVNSIVGEEVSQAGVLRPTTRRPVLVHHPADGDLLAEHPLLAEVDVAARDVVPRGIALIDAPDLDSLVEDNRRVAQRLMDAADLWLFVTTAARYGDALPWHVLDQAAERKVSMAMVLNRVPKDAVVTVRSDLLARLGARGLSSVPLFLVPDAGPHEGLLDDKAVAPVRRWLTVLAGADRAQSVIARTQRGAIGALRPWIGELADAVEAQVEARADLERRVDACLEKPGAAAAASVQRGGVAEGPVRSAWSSRAGSGPLGRGWTSRRGHAARVEALEHVGSELEGAARVALVAARRSGARAVDAAVGDELDDLPVPETAPVVPAPDVDAVAWLADTAAAVEHEAARSRGAARLVRLAGARGAGVVVAGAAVGLGAARVHVEQAMGSQAGSELVQQAADDLVTRVRAQVLAAGASVRAALDTPDLAADAAARLQLRRAVLKEWT
ncbi:dynamin family protein [Actinotalea sp. M2MS4P-6]|uniref:dynamin family protein n=1 Tax=Actinotalea sp. M2MS4P-6 TaxID=2983762 RepID=UPI0021E4AF15|nr:dynamin family protein [Actinotalea sp. M2MS4P-6]MCV2396205.1 dynamin family protein [Actinotalea sp. M2MS4P-6]